jgi:hypothetical protein
VRVNVLIDKNLIKRVWKSIIVMFKKCKKMFKKMHYVYLRSSDRNMLLNYKDLNHNFSMISQDFYFYFSKAFAKIKINPNSNHSICIIKSLRTITINRRPLPQFQK